MYLIEILKSKNIDELKTVLKFRFYNEETCLGLRAEIKPHCADLSEKIQLETRICDEKTIMDIFETEKTNIDKGWSERRKRLVYRKIGRAYVTFLKNTPCHFQWVFDSKDNKSLRRYFKGEYPILKPGEAILEHALTLKNYRQRGIHKQSRMQIFEIENKKFKNRIFISFINPQNTPSLKCALDSGFKPIWIRKELWIFNYHKFTFEKYDRWKHKNLEYVVESLNKDNNIKKFIE